MTSLGYALYRRLVYYRHYRRGFMPALRAWQLARTN